MSDNADLERLFAGLPLAREPRPESLEIGADFAGQRQDAGLSLPPLAEEPPAYRPRVLFIDDEESLLEQCKLIFETTPLHLHAEFETFHFDAHAEARLRALLGARAFDAIYVDRQMPGAGDDGGLGLISRLRADLPALRYVPFIIVTAYPDNDLKRKSRDMGAVRIVIKNNPSARSGALGTLIHRVVTDASESMEQAEDEIWRDLNRDVATWLGNGEPWDIVCGRMVEFLGDHFAAEAIYVRESENPGTFRLRASRASVGSDLMRLSHVRYLKDFVDSGKPFDRYPGLAAADVAPSMRPDFVGRRALVARMSIAGETLGLLTIYRDKSAREFRARDCEGLHHLATQLAGALARIRDLQQRRRRHQRIVRSVQTMDNATKAEDIHEVLRDTLAEHIGPPDKSGRAQTKVAVRVIPPGTNVARRAGAPAGFAVTAPEQDISLERRDRSLMARALWDNELKYCADVTTPDEIGRHTLSNDKIRSSLSIPLSSRGVAVGAICLESFEVDAFDQDDREFAKLLSESAADALLRIRAANFMSGLGALFGDYVEVESIDEILARVVRAIFDLTGASELFLMERSETPPWPIRQAYVHPGAPMAQDKANQWRRRFETDWGRSYVARVLEEGRDVAWTSADVIHDDRGVATRRDDQQTRAEAVIRVTPDGAPEDMAIVLLCLQKHALNQMQVTLLGDMARLIAILYSDRRKMAELKGRASFQEQEARLGRRFHELEHELLNPVALIGSFISAAEGDVMSPTEALRNINAVRLRMEARVAQATATMKLPVFADVEVADVWEECRANLEAAAREADVTIESASFKATVRTDAQILGIILGLLMDNSIRYAGRGATVSLKAEQNAERLRLSFSDTGRGIPAAIGRRFKEAPRRADDERGGRGVYLAQERAQELGGDLDWAPAPTGAHFVLSLPL